MFSIVTIIDSFTASKQQAHYWYESSTDTMGKKKKCQ